MPPRARRPAPDVTLDASIVGAFGATGTGKSAYIKRAIAGLGTPDRPLLIFDPKHEYTGGAIFIGEAGFYQAINGRLAHRLIFRPAFDAELRVRQFDRFCRSSLALARAAGRCAVVADELHLVTDAGSAPAGWRELIQTGRAAGVAVFAASIRPAAIDKDFWTNCTLVRTGRLNFIDDQRALALVLGVKPAEIVQLRSGGGRCDFIERDLLTGQLRRGRLTF